MIRRFLVLVVVLAGLPAGASPAVPLIEGPDVPPATAPIALVNALTDERFTCTESVRTTSIAVPTGWNRVILEFSSRPEGDPWDRLFGVSVGGVEVLRGTTPRTTFTIRRDITPYGSLLPPGGTADVALLIGSYVGTLAGSVRLAFYDEPVVPVAPARAALGPIRWARLNGDGMSLAADIDFPTESPTRGRVELTMSGHGEEEFWFQHGVMPRTFRVLVDGQEIAFARSMPYVYALLGFGNENANTPCVGPGTSSFGDTVHPVMWWTGQQALDVAGVHGGVGEIPPYSAEVDAAQLRLLTGARRVEVVQEGGGSTWVTSLSFLLD